MMDVVGAVDGMGAERLGLAVELAQRNAHGEEELEGVRPHRGAAGGGGGEILEAEPVAQCREQQLVGEPGALSRARRPRLRAPLPTGRSPVSRRSKSIMRARTSAAICSHTRGASSRKVGPISRRSAITVACSSGKLTFIRAIRFQPTEYICSMTHGERQHRDIFVVRALGIGLEIGGGVTEERSMRPLGELGMRGRARGRAQDGDIVGARRRQHALIASGITVERRLAGCFEIGDDHEARVVVFPHAARVEIDDPFDGRNASAEVEELVDLLLVLRDHDFRRSVIER